jgi:PQQ-like domain
MSTQLPFPVVWRRSVGTGWFTPFQAPVLTAATVTVRCGDELAQLAIADGSQALLTTLAHRAGNGTFLLQYADLLLTDIVRRPERLGSVLAVRDDGGLAWRVDLAGIVAPAGTVVVGDRLHVLVTEPGEGVVLYTLDARTGERLSRLVLPWSADGLIPWNDGLLVRNQAAAEGSAGLYTLAPDGAASKLSTARTWRFSLKNDLLAVSSGDVSGELGELHVLTAHDLRKLWSSPAVVETPVLDGGQVFAVDRTVGGDFLIARRASDGAEEWRTGPLERPVLTVDACGSLVFCSHLAGRSLWRRSDGKPVGELTGFHAPPVADHGQLYLVSKGEVSCLLLPE